MVERDNLNPGDVATVSYVPTSPMRDGRSDMELKVEGSDAQMVEFAIPERFDVGAETLVLSPDDYLHIKETKSDEPYGRIARIDDVTPA